MNQKRAAKETKLRHQVFEENPFDLETLFESLKIASAENKELLFIDRVIATLRIDPDCDLTNLNFMVLHDLQLLKMEHTNDRRSE